MVLLLIQRLGTSRRNEFSSMMIFLGKASQYSFQRMPHATNLAITRSQFGRNIESVSFSGVTNAPGYDALGRVVSSTDGRGNATAFQYNALGQRVCAIGAASFTRMEPRPFPWPTMSWGDSSRHPMRRASRRSPTMRSPRSRTKLSQASTQIPSTGRMRLNARGGLA